MIAYQLPAKAPGHQHPQYWFGTISSGAVEQILYNGCFYSIVVFVVVVVVLSELTLEKIPILKKKFSRLNVSNRIEMKYNTSLIADSPVTIGDTQLTNNSVLRTGRASLLLGHVELQTGHVISFQGFANLVHELRLQVWRPRGGEISYWSFELVGEQVFTPEGQGYFQVSRTPFEYTARCRYNAGNFLPNRHNMMTSSNGNIFCVTGPLCGEFTGPRWLPRTKTSGAELWCFLWSASEERLSKQKWGWWFETQSDSLWHHCNETLRP